MLPESRGDVASAQIEPKTPHQGLDNERSVAGNQPAGSTRSAVQGAGVKAPGHNQGDVWTLQDAADFLRCSREQVRRLITQRGLPAFDIGFGRQHEWRLYPEEVIAWTRGLRRAIGKRR